MFTVRNRVLSLFLLSSFCFFTTQAHTQNNAIRSFWHPTFQGERLDYCTLWGKECGKKVANQYCQMLGYEKAKRFEIAPNVGLTNYIATRARCTGWTCNGFMSIDCVASFSHSPPKPYYYTEKQFFHPRFNGYRVDWCYKKNKQCGQMAAFSFCSRMGYIGAKTFRQQKQINATQMIGSQALCFGRQCNAFKSINCYR